MDDQPVSEETQSVPPRPQIPAQPKTSGLAIASLVCALTCVAAPVGLILGIVAAVQIDRNKNELKGMGLAVAGIVIGALATLILPIFAAILFPVFNRARHAAQTTACINNVKQISVAMNMYVSDYDSKFPPAGNWNDAIKPYLKNTNVWKCPADNTDGPSYAMNNQLNGIAGSKVLSPADTVMLFESQPGKNRAGGPELLPSEPQHSSGDIIGYGDFHVAHVERANENSLNWNPKTAPSSVNP